MLNKCFVLLQRKTISNIACNFYAANIRKKMRLTKKSREKLKDKSIYRALEDALELTHHALDRWRSSQRTPYYHKSPLVRGAFLEITGLTEEEAFEMNDEERALWELENNIKNDVL